MTWHFAYRKSDGPMPDPFMCFCLEEEHADLMGWIGTFPVDHAPASALNVLHRLATAASVMLEAEEYSSANERNLQVAVQDARRFLEEIEERDPLAVGDSDV